MQISIPFFISGVAQFWHTKIRIKPVTCIHIKAILIYVQVSDSYLDTVQKWDIFYVLLILCNNEFTDLDQATDTENLCQTAARAMGRYS